MSIAKFRIGRLGYLVSLATIGVCLVAGPVHAQSDPGTDTDGVGGSEVTLGSIVPFVVENGSITVSIDGLGTNAANGLIQVLKPAGATVRVAYMAAASTGFQNRILANGDVKINGVPVIWNIVPTTPSSITSHNSLADVTNIVGPIINAAPAGIVNFTITEVATNGIDGEILVVIFDDPAQTTANSVILLFGAQNIAGDTFNILLAAPLDLSDPNLVLDMSLGISYGFQPNTGQVSLVDVNNIRMTSAAGGQDDGAGANGALLTVGGLGDTNGNPANPFGAPITPSNPDDELYNLIPFVANGAAVITVDTINPSNDDNIFFAALILSVTGIVGQGIVLGPPSGENEVGDTHTVTATVQDDNGDPVVDRLVTFTVTSGPNAGTGGDCTINATCLTDASGQVSFTYLGDGGVGTDQIQACFVDSQGDTQCSNTVTKDWIITNEPPQAICESNPISVNADSGCCATVSVGDIDDGSFDPDGPADIATLCITAVDGNPVGCVQSVTICGDGSHTVELTITDLDGESDSCTATVIIVDGPNTPPDIMCPADALGLECPADTSIGAHGSATATDNCDPNPNITSQDSSAAGCGNTETITRTWTAEDAAGNSSSCNQIIEVVDTTIPTIDNCPTANMVVECDGAGNVAQLNAWLNSFAASDTCGGVTLSNNFNGLSNGCGETGSATVTFTATDDCGLQNSCNATFTIVDTTQPTIDNCPAANMVVECDGAGNQAQLNAWLNSFAASDVCGGVTLSDNFNGLSNGCGETGSATVVFTATDDCGLQNSCTATFTIVDTTDPSIDNCPAETTVECDGAGNTAELNAWLNSFAASDVCGRVTLSDDFTALSDDCGETGTATVVFTATDDCGLQASCTATFTIEDTTEPDITCPDDLTITSGDPTDPGNTGEASGSDLCDNADPDIVSADGLTIPDCLADPIHFVIDREWTATDDCGLSSSCVQTITVLRKEVSLIIKQGACPAPLNPFSNGVAPMLVTGDTDFDVADVFLNTLRLTRCDCSGGDVAPNDGPPGPKIMLLDLNHPFDGDVDCVEGPCACNDDQSSDGMDDIWMKFRTDEMMAGLPLAAGEGVVILSVTGELDAPAYPAAALNAAFIASDCIIVVPPGSGPINATVNSNVLDTFIEVTPLDLNIDSDGFANFGRAYFPGTVLNLAAPPISAGRPFVRWRVDGVLQEIGNRFLELIVTADSALEAIYQRQQRIEPGDRTEDDGDLE